MRTYVLYIQNQYQKDLYSVKILRFWGPKKIFFANVRILETPLPLAHNRTHSDWPLASPFVRTYYVDDPLKDIDGNVHYPLGDV